MMIVQVLWQLFLTFILIFAIIYWGTIWVKALKKFLKLLKNKTTLLKEIIKKHRLNGHIKIFLYFQPSIIN